jgi:hypothetical protein
VTRRIIDRADRWLAPESGVAAVMIVEMQEEAKCLGLIGGP